MVTALVLAGVVTLSQADRAIGGPEAFALLDRYRSSFEDVTFLYEGTMSRRAVDGGSFERTSRFQGFLAYRSDGATLLDIFVHRREDEPVNRTLYSLLQHRLEVLNASPDAWPHIRDRDPTVGVGGAGTLNRQDAPLKIFLPWYFATLRTPAEHEVQEKGWEAVDGHACLRMRMLRFSRRNLEGWVGGLPFCELWVDAARDGYPLRYEIYRGDDLEARTEIARLVRVKLPSGRSIWFPAEGTTWQFLGQDANRRMVYNKKPVFAVTHTILIDSLKFDHSLRDDFFSVKKHSFVASDEALAHLLRPAEQSGGARPKVPPSDPESRRMRLDDALLQADRQARELESSSAARGGAGWFGALSSGGWLSVFGVLVLGFAGFRYWRSR